MSLNHVGEARAMKSPNDPQKGQSPANRKQTNMSAQ
jgi:hypothetical protein